MQTLDLELQGTCSFPMTYFGNEYEKKELKGNDYMMLYGALSIICLNNADLLDMYGYTMQNIIDDASICSNELYLNGFEGYQISDRLNIKSLFINSHGCIIANVYDNKKDDMLHFVV